MYKGITPTVDPNFVKELKRFDPNLDVEFRRDFGTFVITQPSKVSGRVPALAVAPEQNDGRTWRQPNMNDIRALHRADFARRRMRDQVLEGEERVHRAQKKDQAFAADEIKHQTKDNKIQIANTFSKACNTGKGVTAFRQVVPKIKGTRKNGYIVKDRRRTKNL